MKQIYHPYHLWEDYKNGMYGLFQDEKVEDCINLLKDQSRFLSVLKDVIVNWPISTENNLTNKTCNRKAWLGQAACSYDLKATELTTRQAWAALSELDRYYANKTAQSIINHYEIKNRTVHKDMGAKMLF